MSREAVLVFNRVNEIITFILIQQREELPEQRELLALLENQPRRLLEPRESPRELLVVPERLEPRKLLVPEELENHPLEEPLLQLLMLVLPPPPLLKRVPPEPPPPEDPSKRLLLRVQEDLLQRRLLQERLLEEDERYSRLNSKYLTMCELQFYKNLKSNSSIINSQYFIIRIFSLIIITLFNYLQL